MQLDDKYIDKADNFSQKVGEKLREHQMPVDSDVWDSLTDRLPSRKKTVSTYWLWAAAGVAAAVVSLLFLLNPLENDDPLFTAEDVQPQKQIKQEAIVSDIIPDDIAYNTDEKSVPDQIVEQSRTILKKIEEPVEASIPEKTSKIEKEPHTTETTVQVESSKPAQSVEPSEDAKPIEKVSPIDVLESVEIAELSETEIADEQRGLRSLLAALGSGGAPLDFSLGSYDADQPKYDIGFPGGELHGKDGLWSDKDYNLLKPSDYTEVIHRMPVSFSLTADFPVAKNMTLETGLSYTYLFSRYRRNDIFIYRGTLRQHYIGIPVNLRYTVWQNDAWNVYLLGGGAVEKGLRSIYKQEVEHNGGVVYHTNLYSSIKGFQFSAQGGAGFSYRLQGNLSLFGEPRIIYYFNNNQPMSARTENPLIFGLNMGMRIQFK